MKTAFIFSSIVSISLQLLKNEVMDALTGVPYCMTLIYVRNGKLFVELVDSRTIDISRQDKQQEDMSIHK